ncbi:hypothetical protein GCM10009682_22920 [Luedemannella flava]|uniref:DUF308 domain-containing protein n=1 Tax=Luedemannella flava TaxID=349316 RepID=A0ABP4Y538_9ACTN
MASGDPRQGRRDNGLVAAEYAVAGDVDPRVGEHLLDLLALDGIAAYLGPTTDLHPVTRTTTLPDRPTDRLFVDRAHLAAAQAYLRQLGEERRETTDVDEAWAAIVAGYDADVGPHRSWPAAEDVPADARDDEPLPARRVAPPPPVAGDEPSLLDGLDTFGTQLRDDEEGYTPPTPPPLPRPAAPTVLGVVGILAGLILVLNPDLLSIASGTAMLLGFLAILGGFVTLVLRLRPGDDDDDIYPDDGARV